MAKIHLDRLRKRYGYTGKSYRELVQQILLNNNKSVSASMATLSAEQWEKAKQKIKKGHSFVLPSLHEVMPEKKEQILKTAQAGDLISDTLHDRLAKELRGVLDSFTPKTNEQAYITRRGATAGKINPKLIAEYQKNIRSIFQNYTRRNPEFGMPSNVKNIAVTEVRSAIGTIRKQYMTKLTQKNRDKKFFKTWIHNPRLSLISRPGHAALNNKTIPYHDNFTIKIYEKKAVRYIPHGSIAAFAPHDKALPANQVIGCNCDLVFSVR